MYYPKSRCEDVSIKTLLWSLRRFLAYSFQIRFTASRISSALTVLRPAWVANSRASFPTRTATSSTTFRSSSAASSPILPAPPFFMSRCTAAVDISVSAKYATDFTSQNRLFNDWSRQYGFRTPIFNRPAACRHFPEVLEWAKFG